MGEYFMYKGEHALIIYDDLSKQAAHTVSCPCSSVVLRVGKLIRVTFLPTLPFAGTCVKLNDELGGGSLTAPPFI